MRRASSGEDSEREKTSATKSIKLLTWIVTMSGIRPRPCRRSSRVIARQTASSHTVFHDRLGGTLSEKPDACLWPRPPSTDDCDHFSAAMHGAGSIMQFCVHSS